MDTPKPERKDFTNDGEFNKALNTWTASQPKTGDAKTGDAGEVAKLVGFEAPKARTLTGTITHIGQSFESRFTKGSFSRTVTMSGDERFVISEAIYQSNKAYLQVGLEVVVQAEHRIKGKTGYVDASGKSVAHKSDGLGFNSVALSAEQAAAQAKEDANMTPRQRVEFALGKLTSAEVADKDAIAKMLSGFVASK